MRVITLFLSLLLLLQPASWAMGSSVHQQMNGAVTGIHSGDQAMAFVPTGTSTDCETVSIADDQTPTQLQSRGQIEINQSTPGSCQLMCLSACTSSSNYTPVTSVGIALHNFTVVVETPLVSFRSHTESPEIRPPHSIRLQG